MSKRQDFTLHPRHTLLQSLTGCRSGYILPTHTTSHAKSLEQAAHTTPKKTRTGNVKNFVFFPNRWGFHRGEQKAAKIITVVFSQLDAASASSASGSSAPSKYKSRGAMQSTACRQEVRHVQAGEAGLPEEETPRHVDTHSCSRPFARVDWTNQSSSTGNTVCMNPTRASRWWYPPKVGHS